MKTLRKTTRLLPIFLLAAIFMACEKSEPDLSLADQLAGEYTVTSYFVNGRTVNLPATNSDGVTATAQIKASKESDTFATFTFLFTQTKLGVPKTSNSFLRNVELLKSSNGIIESADGRKRVEYANSKMTVIFPGDATVADLTVYAAKNSN